MSFSKNENCKQNIIRCLRNSEKNADEVGKKLRVSTGREVLPPKLCVHPTVIRAHDGALAVECTATVSSTTLVVVESDDHSYGIVDINTVGGTGYVEDTHRDPRHRMLAGQ